MWEQHVSLFQLNYLWRTRPWDFNIFRCTVIILTMNSQGATCTKHPRCVWKWYGKKLLSYVLGSGHSDNQSYLIISSHSRALCITMYWLLGVWCSIISLDITESPDVIIFSKWDNKRFGITVIYKMTTFAVINTLIGHYRSPIMYCEVPGPGTGTIKERESWEKFGQI